MGAVFGFTGPRDRKLVESMKASLSHRGGDAFFVSESETMTVCYLARFEEPVRKKVGAGFFQDEGHTLIVCGYLTGNNVCESTANSLLEGYLSEGPEFLYGLTGAFTIVVADGKTIRLIRDGAGVRTVYYGMSDKRMVFATEPKGILSDPYFNRQIRPASLAQYLTFSFVPGKHTMLDNLFELESGHSVLLTHDRKPATSRHFFFETPGNSIEGVNGNWPALFSEGLGNAVEERLPNDEPVGVFLSGGIDSSVVTAEVARRHTHAVKTFSIYFGKKYGHELDYARSVAETCGTEHREVLIRPKKFLPGLRKIIWHMDDPVGDPVTVPNFELSRIVSKEVRWVFNGEGGDPCFGGPKNIPMLLHHWYGGIERDPLFFEKKYLKSFQRAYNELYTLLTPEWRGKFCHDDDLAGMISPFLNTPAPEGFLEKLQAANIRLKAAHLIYPKVDRMTGAWGLTPLSPLTDESLMRLGFRMPGTMKLNSGIEKVVMKKAYEDILPADIINRPKSGMKVPVRYWFQGEMKRYAKKILSKKAIASAGIFMPDRVRQILDYDKEEGRGRYGLQLWMLITFELWRKIVLEGDAP